MLPKNIDLLAFREAGQTRVNISIRLNAASGMAERNIPNNVTAELHDMVSHPKGTVLLCFGRGFHGCIQADIVMTQ